MHLLLRCFLNGAVLNSMPLAVAALLRSASTSQVRTTINSCRTKHRSVLSSDGFNYSTTRLMAKVPFFKIVFMLRCQNLTVNTPQRDRVGRLRIVHQAPRGQHALLVPHSLPFFTRPAFSRTRTPQRAASDGFNFSTSCIMTKVPSLLCSMQPAAL